MAEKGVGVIEDVTAGGVLMQEEEGLHRGSAPSTFSSIRVMDRLMDEARRESPWAIICIDAALICDVQKTDGGRRGREIDMPWQGKKKVSGNMRVCVLVRIE